MPFIRSRSDCLFCVKGALPVRMTAVTVTHLTTIKCQTYLTAVIPTVITLSIAMRATHSLGVRRCSLSASVADGTLSLRLFQVRLGRVL